MALPVVQAKARPILDLIRVVETARADGSAYETIFGHNEDKLTKKITDMTLAEVQKWQPGFSKTWGSSATGAYQFMYNTLKDMINKYDVPLTEIFSPALQDRLGMALLLRRGYTPWVEGSASTDTFMIGLAKEWASFPVPYNMQGAHREVARGESYYAGDKVNKALITPEKVWLQLEATRKGTITPAPTPTPEPEPTPEPTPTPDTTAEQKIRASVELVVKALQDPTVLSVIVAIVEKEGLKTQLASAQPFTVPTGMPIAKPELDIPDAPDLTQPGKE